MNDEERFGIKDWLRPVATIAWLIVFISWPRVTGSVTLLASGVTLMVYNATIFRARIVNNDDAPAVAPVFGGILAAAGIAILPVEGIWK
jgi:hypothetical protein